MNEQEDLVLTFSDEDFARRYSSDKQTETAVPSRAAPAAAKPAAPLLRSRNRFMRTLLRRRMLSSAT